MSKEWKPKLIYKEGRTGLIEAQIWWNESCSTENMHKIDVLASYSLDDIERGLSLKTLMEKYPAPVIDPVQRYDVKF